MTSLRLNFSSMASFASLVFLAVDDPRSPLPPLSPAEEFVLSGGRCVLESNLERAIHDFIETKNKATGRHSTCKRSHKSVKFEPSSKLHP